MKKTSKNDLRKSFNTKLGENLLNQHDRNRSSFSQGVLRGLTSRAVRVETQTKIFASMCPDEILDHYDSYTTRSYNTTLMLGDISGFTEMTEKFGKSGKGGPSKLTETLNSYIGAMVQEILSHKGDVLKFSGDAFIVMWKAAEGRIMRDIATEAIKTACVIQKHFGTYETDVGVILKVKLAIASGTTHFTSIGDPTTLSYYIITGPPVWEVKHAEGLCFGGDILVTPSCWQWVNPSEYIYEILPDGYHTKIISLSLQWDAADDSISADGFSDDSTTQSSSASKINSSESSSTVSFRSSELTGVIQKVSTFERDEIRFSDSSIDYSLRPKVIKTANLRLARQIKSYILRPVIRSVEMDEPLEYLTEIRQVVIVFINVITSEMQRKTLIELVNSAYTFVCKVVDDMQGCVNKTSLFDKDLMFLCIFGLRGDKHELESQLGLRCALKLRRGLVQFERVQSVTIGVTTGMTYCGVVGHVLRREYTVIGMAVNKAARLMVAYNNKVVCDRETFLLSRLEAKHFFLQDKRVLKGITNVGPIYEFLEQSNATDHIANVSRHPLLGRNKELKNFHNMMVALINGSVKGSTRNTMSKDMYSQGSLNSVTTYRSTIGVDHPVRNMLVRGDARIGKTRLLEEITYIIPSSIRQIFISLRPADYLHPFNLIRRIFYVPLNISDETPPNVKEDALRSRYSKSDQFLLCCLNLVFQVKFPLNTEFFDMDNKEKKSLRKKYIILLATSCFKKLWVLIVDDLELADNESVIIFNTLIKKQKNLLSVLSYGNKLSRTYSMPFAIESQCLIADLTGINIRFHAALACQTLEVVAIPAALEKIIQEESSGNPGWIDSYLISLVQSNGLEKKYMTKLEIHEKGLVTPPKNMIKRHPRTAYEISEMQMLDIEYSKWDMYQYCYKECAPVDGEINPRDTRTHEVCILTESFNLETLTESTTIDAVLLKLYDSLTPLDQKLIKCSAVLGEVIDRKMLEKLMIGTNIRDIAICVAKLFELRILCCAVDNRIRRSSVKLPSFLELFCGCKDIQMDETLDDLPKYACCQLMRFKIDLFRRMTYGLLTENQKVQFHNKALHYLQRNTRRCSYCGGGPFHVLLGESQTVDSDRKRRKPSPETMQLEVLSDSNTSLVGEIKEEKARDQSDDDNQLKSFFLSCMPIKRAPTRSFSQVEFTDCTCNLILLTAYSHVLEHCRGIAAKKLMLIAILEFVEVCLSTHNIPRATKLLEEALELVEAFSQIYHPSDSILIIVPYLKGKIQTLRARCFMASGLFTEAAMCFDFALKIMRYHFPVNLVSIKLKANYYLRRLKLMLFCTKSCWTGNLKGDIADYNDQFSSCLASMFELFRIKGMTEHAKLAAIWGLYVALQSNKNFFILTKSYSNIFIIAHLFHYRSLLLPLEISSLNLCNSRNESTELPEIYAIAELYSRIFDSRWIRGLTAKATSIGFIALRLARTCKSMDLTLWILPRVTSIIVLNLRFQEMLVRLKDLDYESQFDMDQRGKTWYYSLATDFLLETGICLIPLSELDQFYQHESAKICNISDYEAGQRFFSSIWLWYVRMGDWESATVWRNRHHKVKDVHEEYTVPYALTQLRILEAMMLCYIYKKNNKNLRDAANLLHEIKNYLKDTNEMRKIVSSIYPRFCLLKAYYYMIINRKRAALRSVRKGLKVAVRNNNNLLINWCKHNEKNWLGTLNPISRDHWLENIKFYDRSRWHEIEFDKIKIVPFTLPLPKWD